MAAHMARTARLGSAVEIGVFHFEVHDKCTQHEHSESDGCGLCGALIPNRKEQRCGESHFQHADDPKGPNIISNVEMAARKTSAACSMTTGAAAA